MGQARRRGSFEQRQKEGITKEIERKAKLREAREERERSMTPEQKKARNTVGVWMAFAACVQR